MFVVLGIKINRVFDIDDTVGALPIFKTKEDAEKHSDGEFEIVELVVGE